MKKDVKTQVGDIFRTLESDMIRLDDKGSEVVIASLILAGRRSKPNVLAAVSFGVAGQLMEQGEENLAYKVYEELGRGS